MAKGFALAMEAENLASVPIEVPDAGLDVPVVSPDERALYQRSESRWSNGETLVDHGAESVSSRSTVSPSRTKKIEEEAKSPEKEEQQNRASTERIFGLPGITLKAHQHKSVCLTAVADVLDFALRILLRVSAPIGQKNAVECIKETSQGEEDGDVRDASDAETEDPISLTSSPVTRRITFEQTVERIPIGPRGRREYFVRGNCEN